MKRWTLLLAVLPLLATGPEAESDTTFTYQLSRVQRKVVDGAGRRLAEGSVLTPGGALATGWFASATLEVPLRAARFEIGSRSRVRLATETPGVLIELTRGRLRAFFDAWAGRETESRRVSTPSAILAVRGTDFGVVVHGSGATEVFVFEGTVEWIDPHESHPPIRIDAGFSMRGAPGRAPGGVQPHGMSPGGWSRGGGPSSRPAAPGPPPHRPARRHGG